MKLYDTKLAPNPRRVRVFLAEKGITVPTEQVDLGAMQQKSEEYSRLNPFQRTPALVLDDGTVLTESVAICLYFEALQPDPPLFGQGPLGRAMVEMWQRRAEFHLLLPIAMTFRHSHPAMAEMEKPQIPDFAASNRPRAVEALRVLDQELATRQFLAGDSYSIADITAMIAVDFMRPAKIEMPAGLDNLARWYGEVSTRPSAKA
jgi:glutathione S-transferase